MVPESAGGSGMSLLDGVVLYEELGRSLAPLPHFVSCVLSAAAISEAGSPAQQAELLGGIASGETIATVGWLEQGGGYKPRGVQLAARVNGDGFVLDGSKEHVQFAAAADLMVVLARSGDGDTDIDVFVLEAGAPGLSLDQRMSISSDTQYRVTLDGVPVPAGARLGTADAPAGAGWEAWQRAMHSGAILAAAPGRRRRLGRPGDDRRVRQGEAPVQQGPGRVPGHLALPGRRPHRPRRRPPAGVRGGVGPHAPAAATDQLAPMAKLFACRTYREITAMCQQVFGGIGFTVEYDIQLYFRRAKQLQLSWWDQATCEDRIADAVLGPA